MFLADILILLALVQFSLRKQRVPATRTRFSVPGVVGLLLFWVVFRLVFGGRLDLFALRDFAPYVYLGLSILSGASYVRSGLPAKVRTTKILWWALCFHAAWVSFSIAFPDVSAGLPQTAPGVNIFRIRSDFDTGMVGVLGAWALVRGLRGDGLRFGAIAVYCLTYCAGSASRAGFLGAAAAVAVALNFATRGGALSAVRRKALFALAPVALIAIIVLLPSTTAGARLFGVDASGLASAAQGTQQARAGAWQRVVSYTASDPQRFLTGVGFGPNFMADSGAIVVLVGGQADDVRSPHNFLVGTFARLGIIGLALYLSLFVGTLSRAFSRSISSDEESDLYLVANLLAAAIIVLAILGVVLESPFGAIPFAWSVGVIFAGSASRKLGSEARSPQVTDPSSVAARSHPRAPRPAGPRAYPQRPQV